MRWSSAAAVAAFLVAGCASGPGGQDSDAGGQAADPCSLTYPDGSPVPCDADHFSEAMAAAAPPGPQTGWTCKDHNAADTGNNHEVWMNAVDGRVGAAWDYGAQPIPQPGAVILTLYQEGQDQLLFLPFQETGFAEFPKWPTAAPMEIHILVYGFLLFVNDVDPFQPDHWRPASERATVRFSTFGIDPWVTYVYDHDGIHREFDVMVPERSEADKPIYRFRGGLQEGESPWLYPVVSGGGAKYPNRDPLLVRANPGFCYAEDLPVRGFAPDTPPAVPLLRNH